MYFCNLLLISPFILQELAEVSKFRAFSMSGSLCWLSFNSYYFSAWPIHHLECFLIYCRDNVDSSDMEDIHCGLEMKTPGCRFRDRNIIFPSSEVSNLPLCFDLWRGLDGERAVQLAADRTSAPLIQKLLVLSYELFFSIFYFFYAANVHNIIRFRCLISVVGKYFNFCSHFLCRPILVFLGLSSSKPL